MRRDNEIDEGESVCSTSVHALSRPLVDPGESEPSVRRATQLGAEVSEKRVEERSEVS